MVYLLNMAHLFLMILLLLSLVSFVFSTKDKFSIAKSYNVTINSTISVGIGNQSEEIKLDEYANSQGLAKLFKNLDSYRTARSFIIGTVGFYRKPIYAVRISRNVQEKRKLLVPMFKYVANMNGDETVGYALMVSLIQYLVYSDGVDEGVTRLLNTTDIWIIPTMNPDRLYSLENKNNQTLNPPDSPFNGNNVELDEDFPNPNLDYTWSHQDETQTMLNFIKKKPFVLSGNLQGGALAARYPFDNADRSEDLKKVSSLNSDDDVFKKLANDYVEKNPMMKQGYACDKFNADKKANRNCWHEQPGSNMRDANYHLSNCFEITFHVSCCKWGPPSDLPSYWALNLPSMLNYIDSIHQGIYGLVRDKEGDPIEGAIVEVSGKTKLVKTTYDGEYWRLLVPGLYNVTVHASPKYIKETKSVNLTATNRYVQLDFSLDLHSLSGTVMNEDNDKPVKRGTITAQQIERKEQCVNFNVKDGKFGKTLPPGTYNITVSAVGYKSESTEVTVTEKKPVELELSLDRLGVIGIVRELSRRRVKDAVIRVLSKESIIHGKDNTTYISMEPVVSSTGRMLETVSDEDGEYWLFLESGNYTIYVTAPGFITYQANVRVQDRINFNFYLHSQKYFQGVRGLLLEKVRGAPTKGVVEIFSKETEETIVLKPEANGCFNRPLDTGNYNIIARAPGYISETRKLKIETKRDVKVQFFLAPIKRNILEKICL